MDIFDNPSVMTEGEGEPRIIDTIFNVTGLVNNLFNTSNNALFTYVGGLVLFIVLVELALYALDVYYNQTFNSGYNFSQRNDGKDPNSIYTDYPPYPDPYLETYRSYSTWNMTKILEWLALMNDSYTMADNTVSYFDCQKRAICEIWRAENGFKFTNVMNNMFQISEFMNMPDDINFILDELGEARNDAKENEVTCEEMYNQCPSKTIMDIVNRARNLVMK